ncbi:hypothetical protein Mycsm_04300 [Mycobacterium sp. JS623]|uniref:hypothetical protein n=1 Tax=Mycobacterium sp. JS623 TaxID=212767 RepID=UPI0002A580D1|nr:hypothetical protein [Mycobacterium sp. JS623]AGB24548.1 hypothetical protein Mycsm_04300 [Mycobacterium sp. JS623]
MSPRAFVAILGVLLIVAGFAVYLYQPTVSDQGYSVQCEKHGAQGAPQVMDNRNVMQGVQTDLAGMCRDKGEVLTFLQAGLFGVGVITVMGCAAIRTKKDA